MSKVVYEISRAKVKDLVVDHLNSICWNVGKNPELIIPDKPNANGIDVFELHWEE